METDVIPNRCAIWRLTGGGLVAAKGGYHYVAFSLGNKMLTRSRREKKGNYETKSPEAIITGKLWVL